MISNSAHNLKAHGSRILKDLSAEHRVDGVLLQHVVVAGRLRDVILARHDVPSPGILFTAPLKDANSMKKAFSNQRFRYFLDVRRVPETIF